ncbi:MAG: hypothetical protein QOI47_696 [Actinomycetota bacterium]|nr:hypothetical protein [Actinomycetota bacterium]
MGLVAGAGAAGPGPADRPLVVVVVHDDGTASVDDHHGDDPAGIAASHGTRSDLDDHHDAPAVGQSTAELGQRTPAGVTLDR